MVEDQGDSWSALLAAIVARPGWNVSRLAREAGLHRTTIHDWMKKGAGRGLTIDSVYRIADAAGIDRPSALKAAGNLPPDDRDVEVQLILSSGFDEITKAQMIERLMQRRQEEKERRIADLRWMLERNTEAAG